MKWKPTRSLLCGASLVICLALPSVGQSEETPSAEPNWKERALKAELAQKILEIELKQFKDENTILHQWRDLDNRKAKVEYIKEAKSAWETYKKEQAEPELPPEPEKPQKP